MSSMTPIRIRGKRKAPKEVKWHAGKERKAQRLGSSTASEPSSSARSKPSAGSMSRRRSKKRDVELSRLEELPTEVLQAIFEYSANLEMPLASPRLASQLASQHLHHSLTSILLDPVLDEPVLLDRELSAAMRLMNSKFFTWVFFRSWLHEEFERRDLLSECQAALGDDKDQWSLDQQEEWIWYQLRPNPNLAPPLKLLRAPFTQERVRFLRFLTSSFRPDLDFISPMYLEHARDGLQQAVSEGAGAALFAFWTFGLQPDTELLRLAVIDSGCDKDLVRSLISRVTHLTSNPVDVDFLDPALWSWAEKAQANGNDKGPWLKDLLKDAARQTDRKDAEIKHARSILYE